MHTLLSSTYIQFTAGMVCGCIIAMIAIAIPHRLSNWLIGKTDKLDAEMTGVSLDYQAGWRAAHTKILKNVRSTKWFAEKVKEEQEKF